MALLLPFQYFQLLPLCLNFTFDSVTHSFNILLDTWSSCQTFWSQDTFTHLKIKSVYLSISIILEIKTKLLKIVINEISIILINPLFVSISNVFYEK